MSYLNLPRINFAGLFEADVNTVNNDVRNYDVEVFEPRFQTLQKVEPDSHVEYNGWWNPNGSNRFSLIDCAVTGVVGPAGEEVVGSAWTLQAQLDRTAAKIVDLDPQFQMASGLWGLKIALMVGDERLVEGSFVPASFRDLFFGRLNDPAGQPVQGSPGASARFTGGLEQLRWTPKAHASPSLAALRASADRNNGRLSLSLVTYGYAKTGAKGALTGTVIGSLGSWLEGEPLTFAPGRRFSISASSPNAPFSSASNLGFMTALVTDAGRRLSVDFGVSLPLQQSADGGIHPQDLGPLTIAVAKAGDTVSSGPSGLSVTPGVTEGQVLTPGLYEVVGVVSDYAQEAWLSRTGGVIDLAVPEAARALIADHPLLILLNATGGGQQVAIRESFGGLWARADNFIQRVDSAPTGWVSSTVDIRAMRWGLPWSDAPLTFSIPPVSGQGGTGDDNEVKPPQTDIPDNNVPLATVSLPNQAVSGADGAVSLTYWVANPGNPRGYIDGQVYQFAYAPAVAGGSPTPLFEVIATHVRDAFVPPKTPSWATDIEPVLVQYGNLYPIMSRGLFSLSDFNSVAANARLLHLAFTLPPTDPNYMPATRDLSAGKLRMIVDWLSSYLPEGAEHGYGAIPPLPIGQSLPPPKAVAAAPAAAVKPSITPAAFEAVGPGSDGKSAAVRGFLRNATRNVGE